MSRSFTAGAPTGRGGLEEVNPHRSRRSIGGESPQVAAVYWRRIPTGRGGLLEVNLLCQVATVVHSWMRAGAVLSSNSFSSRSVSSFHTCRGIRSEVTRGHQEVSSLIGLELPHLPRHSEALRGNQRPSERPSAAISCRQRHSPPSRGHQRPSEAISGAIRGHQWPRASTPH